MSLPRPPRPSAPDAGIAEPVPSAIRAHAAFCALALPQRAPRGAWEREIDGASIRIEPGEEGWPGGRLLRLALLHLGEAALAGGSPAVELAEDPAALSAVLGIDPPMRDMAEQWRRLQGARIVVSWQGGPEIPVLDARGRPRAGGPAWRPGVRLSGKFVASLADHAVSLDRAVVAKLSATPAALDAYAWMRLALAGAAPEEVVTTGWEELLRRFGTPAQDPAAFRSGFETALRLVFDAGPGIDLAVDEDGVSLRHATEDDGAAEPAPAPAAVAPPLAEPAPAPLAAPPATAPSPQPPSPAPQQPLPRAAEAPQPAPAPTTPAAAMPAQDDVIEQDSISIGRHLTGLTQVIWLRRGHGEESILVGVTPGPRFEPARLTVLAVEPMVIQVSGGLPQQEFERVSAWVMANRDLIDEFWEGGIETFSEIARRVRKAPAIGWR